MKKYIILIGLLLLNLTVAFSQKSSKIVIESADFGDVNENEIPNATVLTGNVRVSHDGVIMTCNKAYYFKDENYIKAFGNVEMVQGDTLYLDSKYAEYNGNIKKAFASGNVIMRSPESTLTTDTIFFDRNIQEAYFNSNGIIVNKGNTLKSKAGRYYVKEKKYQFLSSVELTNPEYIIKSNHLDYKTTQGNSVLKGPSTIVGKETFIYTENGYYNSKNNTGHFLQKSYIKYKDRLIEGDSLYYDRKKEFASGTHNVKITDSINKAIIKGHYGEIYKKKDSLFITKHASIRFLNEKDSMFIHAKKIIVTGKVGERIIRGQNNVRFFKTDLSGKCDSIHSDQKKNLTQLIGKPILWNYENQLTGDLMHLIGNNKTEKLDSLKVLNNTFIISKDTIGTGYNQVKGQNLYGRFENNKLSEADVIKNTEVIYYIRNDKQELIGIKKSVCSKINMILDTGKINTITYFKEVDGDIYPEKDLPENARKLRGFVWRGDERIKTKEEIFPQEEIDLDKAIVEESKKKYEKEKISQEIENNKLEEHINGDEFYEEIFRKYNNRLLRDKNGQLLLVQNFKFKFSFDPKTIQIYGKKHPKYKEVITVDEVLWDWKKSPYGKYDGRGFTGDEELAYIEFPQKEYLTYDEIFSLYDNRIVLDKNGTRLFVKDGKFKNPVDENSFENLKKNFPKQRTEVRINQVLWNWGMVNGKYDGGLFNGNE